MTSEIGVDRLQNFKKDFKKLENKEKGKLLQRFFKTGKGEYGEGDIFAGLTVPQSRSLAVKYKDLDFPDITFLLKSKIHEQRLIALLILVHNFQKKPLEQRTIYEFYLKNTKYINNWDLVDLSSHEIVGGYLEDKPKEVLLKLAKSKNLWEKRIAIISTFTFIRDKKFETSLRIAEILIGDKEDLIQKATGWMLREIGKRDLKTEEVFLKVYYQKMGRTGLRYAIEKFPEQLRQKYLLGKI
jgi:3-methyladenine DNA glycosylase AlkD